MPNCSEMYSCRFYVVDKNNIHVLYSLSYAMLLPVLNGTFYFHQYLQVLFT